MEGVHLGPAVDLERDVSPLAYPLIVADPEKGFPSEPKPWAVPPASVCSGVTDMIRLMPKGASAWT